MAKGYREKVLACWTYCAEKAKDKSASAADVTDEMAKRGWLSPMDTVIDIADIMRGERRE
jgi:hypothetical protein